MPFKNSIRGFHIEIQFLIIFVKYLCLFVLPFNSSLLAKKSPFFQDILFFVHHELPYLMFMLEKNIQDLENLKTQARQRKSIFLFCN